MTLRLTTAGESHGPALVAILSGLPAGLVLDRDAIDAVAARRRIASCDGSSRANASRFATIVCTFGQRTTFVANVRASLS